MSLSKNVHAIEQGNDVFRLNANDFIYKVKPDISKTDKYGQNHLKSKPKNKVYTAYLAGILRADSFAYLRDAEAARLAHLKIYFYEKHIETLFKLMLYLHHAGMGHQAKQIVLRAKVAFEALNSLKRLRETA